MAAPFLLKLIVQLHDYLVNIAPLHVAYLQVILSCHVQIFVIKRVAHMLCAEYR